MTNSLDGPEAEIHPRRPPGFVGVSLRWIGIVAVAVLVLWAWRRTTDPLSPATLLNDGLVAIKLRQWSESRRIQNELTDSGHRGESAILEAQTALSFGDYPTAELIARRARQLESKMFRHSFAICVESLYKSGQLFESESLALEWLTIDPDEPVAHRWLAAIYYDLGAMEQARHHLIKLIELRPEDPAPRYLLGVIFHDYERFSDAIPVLSDLLELSNVPDDQRRDGQQRLTTCLIRSNRFEDALALTEDTDSVVPLAQRAECLKNLGQIDLARKTLEKAQSLESNHPVVLSVLAQLQMDDADYISAEQSLKELVRSDPGNIQASYLLERCLRLMGRTADADEQLKKFEQRQRIMLKVAELHLDAIKAPKDPEIREHIAKLLDQIGDSQKAAMWKKAAAFCRSPQASADTPATPPNTIQ